MGGLGKTSRDHAGLSRGEVIPERGVAWIRAFPGKVDDKAEQKIYRYPDEVSEK